MTIASGGVLPRIQPELLAKKRGAKGKSETILSPAPEKKGRKSMVNKKSGKKAKSTKARTSKKVSMGQVQILCHPLKYFLDNCVESLTSTLTLWQ